MSSTIQFKIRGNRPPFVVDLRESTIDGTIIQTVNLSESGATEFTNVASGNYFIVANDSSQTITSYPVNVAAATTTTTTTTTTTLSPLVYYLVGANLRVNKTENGGSTWVSKPFPFPATTSIRVCSIVNDTAYALLQTGFVYKTINGGDSWTNTNNVIPSPSSLGNAGMIALNENTVLVGSPVTDNFFYRTTNGGTTWSPVAKGVYMAFTEFEFVSLNVGYVINTFPNIGGAAVVAKTTNGGISWTNITVPALMPTSHAYLDISFFGDTGYIVRGNDPILKTTNGGTSWTTLPIPSVDFYVSGIKALSSNIVIAVGSNGGVTITKIARSTDGGTTWTITEFPVAGNGSILGAAYSSKAFNFFDNNHGIIPLNSTDVFPAKTLVTTNGGVTWNFGGTTEFGGASNNHWDIKPKRLPLT